MVTAPVTMPRRANRLRKGDRIVCRGDGAVERVTATWSGGKGTRVVRTTRHDHRFRNEEGVEYVVPAP